MAASIFLIAAFFNGSDLDLESAWKPHSAMGRKQLLTYLSNDWVMVPHSIPARDFNMHVNYISMG